MERGDWNIWKVHETATGAAVSIGVAKVGDEASTAFPDAEGDLSYERRATVHRCTKKQAESVMITLNPRALGMPS